MKHYIQNQHDTQLEQQPVNLRLEQNLAQSLFTTAKPKHHFKWRKLLSWPALFTTVSMAAIIIVGIYFSRQSLQPVQTVLSNVKQELVDPKLALAESLEYTFGKDSFVHSFGLGNPDEFRYRKIVVTAPHQKRPFITEDNNEGAHYGPGEFEDISRDWPEYTFSATLDIWAYQGNARLDEVNFASDQLDNKYYDHAFISQIDQRVCYNGVVDNSSIIKERCPSIQAEKKQRTINYLQTISLVSFSDNIDPNFVVETQVEPSVRTVDLTDHVLNYPTVNVRFATKEPITKTKIAYYSKSSIGGSDRLYNTSTYPGYYVNHKAGDLYWHSTSEGQGIDGDGNFYIQFIEGKRATPIYRYQASDNTLTVVDYNTMVSQIEATVLQENFMEGLYHNYLMPGLYLMKYFNDFSEPIEQASEIKLEHATTRLRFVLPASYYAMVNSGVGGMPDDPEYIDIWFDPQSNQIVAYNLLDKDQAIISGIEIQADYVVTDIIPEQFFSFEYWKQAVGLRDDQITDEPLKMERPAEIGG